MKRVLIVLCLSAAILTVRSVARQGKAAGDLSAWANEFRQAIVSGQGRDLERFFTSDAFEREIPGWKYNLKNGFLDFSGTEVIPLSGQAVLLHIPTDCRPFSGENEDAYFDFIYRIYEIGRDGGAFRIVGRGEDAFLPDFVDVRSRIDIRPEEQQLLVESTVTADLKNNLLLFKLAKEFEIEEFRINDQKAPFRETRIFYPGRMESGNSGRLLGQGKSCRLPGTIISFSAWMATASFYEAADSRRLPRRRPEQAARSFFPKTKPASK